MTIQEELNYFMNQEYDYGKTMQLWYKPQQNSRKWRKASLVVVLSANSVNDGNKLQKQEKWYSTIWYEVGSNPNEANFKW